MSTKTLLRDFAGTLSLLCAYGFFKEVKPSEPYLTQYLIGPKNLTQDQVYYEVYPVWTYSYLCLLIPVFLLTDLVRYKPMIIFEGFSYVLTWVLLLWANGVFAMQFMEFMYGSATSTEVAYYTYIYVMVPSEHYQMVSSLTRSATLFGKFLSGLMSQLLISFDLTNYRGLNYISLTSVSIGFILSMFLPSAQYSVYFHKKVDSAFEAETDNSIEHKEHNHTKTEEKKFILKTIYHDAMVAYKSSYTFKWSLWMALSTGLYFQIGNYIQGLWEEIKPSSESFKELTPFEEETADSSEIFNGAVEAVSTLTGTISVLLVGYIKANWKRLGHVVIPVVAAGAGVLLIFMSMTNNIWVAYIGYILFRMSYNALVTVAYFEIARSVPGESTAVIFGFNTWLALASQSIITLIIVDKAGLSLPIRSQFLFYGSYYIAIGVCFALTSIISCLRPKKETETNEA